MGWRRGSSPCHKSRSEPAGDLGNGALLVPGEPTPKPIGGDPFGDLAKFVLLVPMAAFDEARGMLANDPEGFENAR